MHRLKTVDHGVEARRAHGNLFYILRSLVYREMHWPFQYSPIINSLWLTCGGWDGRWCTYIKIRPKTLDSFEFEQPKPDLLSPIMFTVAAVLVGLLCGSWSATLVSGYVSHQRIIYVLAWPIRAHNPQIRDIPETQHHAVRELQGNPGGGNWAAVAAIRVCGWHLLDGARHVRDLREANEHGLRGKCEMDRWYVLDICTDPGSYRCGCSLKRSPLSLYLYTWFVFIWFSWFL